MFDPQQEYQVVTQPIRIEEFHKYAEEYIVRPPYQRKNVWTTKKQKQLLDSLFRRYYVPRIVIRRIRLSDDRTVKEVVDGQQRIYTVQRFFRDELSLPDSLENVSPDLPGKVYSQLPPELRRFIDRELRYEADVITGIEDAQNPGHQRIASEIFWRLQQGETLTYMEIAHSRLSSLTRNFVEKYADDIRFDYGKYAPVDENPDKHPFFKIIKRPNDRMQHLALLTRMLMIEVADGPTDLKDSDVMTFIDRYQQPGGIGDYSFEKDPVGQSVLRVLTVFHKAFGNDPMLSDGSPIQELRREYFILSMFMLLRHLLKYYVFGAGEQRVFAEFLRDFHARWEDKRSGDVDVITFSDNRQQSRNETETRHLILRQLFFTYARDKRHAIVARDTKRVFSEAERIRIYRRDNGLCQICRKEGKPEADSKVPWSQYEADHVIPHSRGGVTEVDNAQLLCRYHNRAKGSQASAAPTPS